MNRISMSVLAYAAAGLTLILAALTPFVLIGFFSNAVAHAGLHIDNVYSGGSVARTIVRGAYRIDIYQPVEARLLQRTDPFVQITWTPASALPSRLTDQLDLDGDGRNDVQVLLDVPADARSPIQGEVRALNERYRPIADLQHQSFSKLMVRTGDRILVRVPLSRASQ